MSTETTDLVPAENSAQKKEYATPAERFKAAEMPVLRRTVEDLANEQKACEMILTQILGAGSLLIPEDLRKDPKAALALIHYARDSGIHYQEVLQNAFVVKGKISFNTKFLITQLRRRFSIMPEYEFSGSGENLTCTVRFNDLSRIDQNGDPLYVKGVEYTLTLKEGLQSSNGSDVWKKQPKKMLQYRAAKMAIDTHWPGILGFDSGEREEYIEWANASSHIPTEGVRTVRIMGNAPTNTRLENMVKSVGPLQIESPKQEAKETQPEPATEHEFPPSLYEELSAAMQSATGMDQLSKIVDEINANKSNGELIADEISELQEMYKKRVKELK